MKVVGYGHSNCIGLLLSECYDQELFCNVTLHCLSDSNQGEVFFLRANSSVLAAAYPVFRTLLQGRNTETTDIHITIAGFRYEEISSLLQFAYTGIILNTEDTFTQSVMKSFGVDATKLRTEPHVPQSRTAPTITTTGMVPATPRNKENSQRLQEIPISQCGKTVNGDPAVPVEPKPAAEHDTRPVLVNGNYVFRCHICSCTFKFIRGLETHMEGHNPDPKSALQCKKCGAHFLNSGSLARHDRVCNSNNPLSYKCEICNGGFSTKISVKKHMLKYHRNSLRQTSNRVQNLKRTPCGESIRTHQLTSHSKVTSTENASSDEGEFRCSICPRNFPVAERLNDHLSLHTSGRLFECVVCSCAYDTVSNLTRHKTKHKLNYECEICCAKFQSLVEKQEHDAFHHMEVQGEEIV